MNRKLSALRITVLTLWVTAALISPARADYPEKSIELVVPFTPGGATDAIARYIAKALAERLKQNVVVQNIGGGGGNIGGTKVAKSTPDGYTLLVGTTGTITLNTLIYRPPPFDPLTDLTPVALIAETDGALVVTPSLGVKSVSDLIALAKARPNELNFGSTGVGGMSHLNGEKFKLTEGIRMTHVPYKGSAPALTDLIGGQTQVMFSDVALPHVKTGKLQALAVTGTKRSPNAPGVATFRELGISGYESYVWFGIFAPSGTPSAIISRLNKELNTITRDPEFQKWMQSQNGRARWSTSEEFSEVIKKDLSKWSGVVKEANITAD